MNRLCADCNLHRAIEDGRLCHECLAALLRRTRPDFLRAPAWVQRVRENRLPAKVWP